MKWDRHCSLPLTLAPTHLDASAEAVLYVLTLLPPRDRCLAARLPGREPADLNQESPRDPAEGIIHAAILAHKFEAEKQPTTLRGRFPGGRAAAFPLGSDSQSAHERGVFREIVVVHLARTDPQPRRFRSIGVLPRRAPPQGC
jgi:hypothetical protein